MANVERKRTMVYSNVHKKADLKSASKNNDTIDFDNEVFIGVKSFPKPENPKKQKNTLKNEKKGQAIKQTQNNNDEVVKEKTNAIKKVINIFKKKNQDDDIFDSFQKPKLTKAQKIRMQKIRIVKKLSIILLMIILLIGGTIYFILSPAFNVKTVEVVNNKKFSSEQIVSMSEIPLNENMFKFSKKEVKNKIMSNPYVENVDVTRNIFTSKVKIDITERTATLMLDFGNSYVYINNQGYILEISPIKIDSPIIKGYVTPLEDIKPGNRLNKDDLERLEIVLKILETAQTAGIENLITQIDIKNKKDYIMVLESEDKTVYLGNCTDLSTQMLYIKEMLQREKGIEGEFFVNMDLNTGNPVFREKV